MMDPEQVEGEGASRSRTRTHHPPRGRGSSCSSLSSPPRERLNQALMDQRDAGADEIRAAVRA